MTNDRFANPILHYGFLAIIYALGGATLLFHALFHGTPSRASNVAQTAACTQVQKVAVVTVSQSGFSPSQLTVPRCTSLVFVATDKVSHDPALGEHTHHDHSQGYGERVLSLGQSNSVLLQDKGTFEFHDHLNEYRTGSVTVE